MERLTFTKELTSPPMTLPLLRITRPFSNLKNAGIVALAYVLSGTAEPLTAFLWPFLAISCVCSAMYALNALMDTDLDRQMANKRIYADAVTRVGTTRALGSVLALAALGIFLGVLLNRRVAAALLALAVTAIVYSVPPFRFKERRFLDVVFGAALTFPLRFLASWFAFSIFAPPLLPLLGLVFGKSSVYLLYKELDREDLSRARVRNTTTSFPRAWNTTIALIFLALSVSAFTAMIVMSDLGILFLGALPRRAFIALPLCLPPIILMVTQATGKTLFNYRVLRAMGILYAIIAIAITWAFVTWK